MQLLWFSLEGCHANWLWPFLLQRMPRKSLYVSGPYFDPFIFLFRMPNYWYVHCLFLDKNLFKRHLKYYHHARFIILNQI